MEESVSGFKTRGSWTDVVEHGERITRALKDVLEEASDESDASPNEIGEALAAWDEWRPKHDERLDEDVSEKTAEQASVEEGAGEREGKDPDEDLLDAGEKLAESYDNLDDRDEAVDKWSESIDLATRAADSASRKALRALEGAVYRNLMTQISPYYFDNELVSANIDRAGQDDYVFEVNVNDDDLKIRVSNELADLEQTVDRWHVDTPKQTESVAAAEGVEPPTNGGEGTDGESTPTTN